MIIPRSLREWLRLPSRVALLLGLGALSAAGARADVPGDGPHGNLNQTPSAGVLIRTEGGRVFVSEGGKEFQELQVMDTAELRYLKQLLDENKEAVVHVEPLTVADSGAGFMWPMPEKTDTGKAASAKQPAVPEKTTPPEKTVGPDSTDTSRSK